MALFGPYDPALLQTLAERRVGDSNDLSTFDEVIGVRALARYALPGVSRSCRRARRHAASASELVAWLQQHPAGIR